MSTTPTPDRRQPVMDEDSKIELYTREWRNKVARLVKALEAVIAAGRPHGRGAGSYLCECEGCEAYDGAKETLEAKP